MLKCGEESGAAVSRESRGSCASSATGQLDFSHFHPQIIGSLGGAARQSAPVAYYIPSRVRFRAWRMWEDVGERLGMERAPCPFGRDQPGRSSDELPPYDLTLVENQLVLCVGYCLPHCMFEAVDSRWHSDSP